jgi:hypothetical protein
MLSRGIASASLAAPTFEDFCTICETLIARRRVHVADGVAADGEGARRGRDAGRGPTLPLSSASAMVNGFRVEPGSNRSVMTRLRSCAPVSFVRLFGLKEGRWRAPGSRRCVRR